MTRRALGRRAAAGHAGACARPGAGGAVARRADLARWTRSHATRSRRTIRALKRRPAGGRDPRSGTGRSGARGASGGAGVKPSKSSHHVACGAGPRHAGAGAHKIARGRRRRARAGGLGIAVLRSFLQLTAVGFVIQAIFEGRASRCGSSSCCWPCRWWSARSRRGGRAKAVPNPLVPLLLALGIAVAAGTLGLVIVLGIFEPKRAVAGAGRRDGRGQRDDRRGGGAEPPRRRAGGRASSAEVEARPGARGPIAARRRAARGAGGRCGSGLIPLIDQTKTTGIVAFPGIMVGMLLAGAGRDDAVRAPARPPLRPARRRRAVVAHRRHGLVQRACSSPPTTSFATPVLYRQQLLRHRLQRRVRDLEALAQHAPPRARAPRSGPRAGGRAGARRARRSPT